MKNSTLLGSAATVLLLFSIISYSRTYIQPQDPKPVQLPGLNQQVNSAPATTASATAAKEPTRPATTNAAIEPVASSAKSSEKTIATGVVPPQTYTATAYSLRGRTASGRPVARGVIAADPRVLPLGSRVRIEAGEFSGEYVVADTGGAVRGHRVDIWTPNSREAMRFGRRIVKLTVLELGGTRGTTASTRSRRATSAATTVSTEQTTKQQK